MRQLLKSQVLVGATARCPDLPPLGAGSRLLAALRTRREQIRRSGPNGRLPCGGEARPNCALRLSTPRCEHFFSAKPALESQIMAADHELAQAFGYSSCCVPPLNAHLQRTYALEGDGVRPAGVPTDTDPAGGILVGSLREEAEVDPLPHRLPSPRLNVSKSSTRRHIKQPKLVVVVSTQRGASTEVAETVGMHPCGASFNELLVHGQFPSGYDKYKQVEGGIPAALNQLAGEEIVGTHLRHRRWLDDAVRVRDRFCSSRPQPVKDHCGEDCVVALKMHLNNYIDSARDEAWIHLLTSPHVAAVVVQREGVENYCSIVAAQETGFWGHNPAEHINAGGTEETDTIIEKAAELKSKCIAENSTAANEWSKEIDARFDVARQELNRAGRLWLDVPFEQFVDEGGGGVRSEWALRILGHLDLGDPEVWDTCGLPWCTNYSWPWPVSTPTAI